MCVLSMLSHHYTRPDIKPHVKFAVSLVIVGGHVIFPRVYVGIYGLTYSLYHFITIEGWLRRASWKVLASTGDSMWHREQWNPFPVYRSIINVLEERQGAQERALGVLKDELQKMKVARQDDRKVMDALREMVADAAWGVTGESSIFIVLTL